MITTTTEDRQETGQLQRGIDTQLGEIYLLHFDQLLGDPSRPVATAGHYTGWAHPGMLEQRLERHRKGTSKVPIVRAFKNAGATFELARTRKGDRYDERAIKNAGGAYRYCPICMAREELVPFDGVWTSDDPGRKVRERASRNPELRLIES